jgi:hypothetical protein
MPIAAGTLSLLSSTNTGLSLFQAQLSQGIYDDFEAGLGASAKPAPFCTFKKGCDMSYLLSI